MNFEKVIPILRMFDVAKAKEFYVDYLGFTVDWEHRFDDNAPLFMQVSRDGMVVHLSEHYGDGSPGSAIFVWTNGLHDFHAELTAKNYKYFRPGIDDWGFGFEVMAIKDPFGNAIRFAERISRM